MLSSNNLNHVGVCVCVCVCVCVGVGVGGRGHIPKFVHFVHFNACGAYANIHVNRLLLSVFNLWSSNFFQKILLPLITALLCCCVYIYMYHIYH